MKLGAEERRYRVLDDKWLLNQKVTINCIEHAMGTGIVVIRGKIGTYPFTLVYPELIPVFSTFDLDAANIDISFKVAESAAHVDVKFQITGIGRSYFDEPAAAAVFKTLKAHFKGDYQYPYASTLVDELEFIEKKVEKSCTSIKNTCTIEFTD